MAQTQPQKLNLFQRGILQKAATVAVYFVSFAAMAFTLDWLEKQRVTVVAEKAQRDGILSLENFRDLKARIATMDETAIFAIIIVGLICGGIGWALMRWAANLNWSWPVTDMENPARKTAEAAAAINKPGGNVIHFAKTGGALVCLKTQKRERKS